MVTAPKVPEERLERNLNFFEIELPSWGFADTGTRFGKYRDPSAAITLQEKLDDAAQVNLYTGCCPSVAVHVLWDFPNLASVNDTLKSLKLSGVRIGSINPNVFQDQCYKFGSLANPDPSIRARALKHLTDSVNLAKLTNSRYISLWFADGSNYPGTAHFRQRRAWFVAGLQQVHECLDPEQRLLIEYKPFEPAFYHTDIADWGMALLLARDAGPQARVLIDTGHHYAGQNIEQVVAWLLSEKMLGGFHFNDRRYADDDLTLGSIDPYQAFRIFHEILLFEWETGSKAEIAFMVDQSHNLKIKTEAMIQTVVTAQELYAKASLVNYEALLEYQRGGRLIDAEETLRQAFFTDVRPLLEEWRTSRGLPKDPLKAFRESGYLEKVIKERAGRHFGKDGEETYA